MGMATWNNDPPTRAEIARLKARCERLEKLAAFLACTIKAGEKWTEQCQREFIAALADEKETTT